VTVMRGSRRSRRTVRPDHPGMVRWGRIGLQSLVT
jgi:hypothetical protein